MDPEIINSLLPASGQSTVQLLALLVILSFLPLIVLTTTPFLRIVIVLYLLRGAVGVQSSPPNLVITGLSMILTLFVMAKPIESINQQALIPLAKQEITLGEALYKSYPMLKNYMLSQVDTKDIEFVYHLNDTAVVPNDPSDVDFIHLVAAHILTELRIAFSIGFLMYIPFLVIDLIVANTLLALGMMMLNPTIVSLPFKLMIFVGVDGWGLVIRGLVESFD